MQSQDKTQDKGVTSSIGANPTLLLTPSCLVQTRCLSDQCTWPRGHCLLFDLREAPLTIMTGSHNGQRRTGTRLTKSEACLQRTLSPRSASRECVY
ncbi:hypothetical protein TNCV_1557211 [Trichonephila clavipes]|nr:hypothetical protein TNCV_1557211 [Trichonephila clavipes]